MLLNLFWHNRAVTFVVLSLGFGAVYTLNNVLTAPLLLAPGAHLVHLPSGFKFLIVLVFGVIGALSIFTVSLIAALGFFFEGNLPLAFELAIANAIAPLLTYKFFVENLSLHGNLTNLNWKTLAAMGLVFSLLNSSLNQLILYWNHVINNLLDGLQIMLIGDISGVFLVLGLIRFVMHRLKPAPSTDLH